MAVWKSRSRLEYLCQQDKREQAAARGVGQHTSAAPVEWGATDMVRRRQPPVGALRRRPASSILGDRAVGFRHSCCVVVSVKAKRRLLHSPTRASTPLSGPGAQTRRRRTASRRAVSISKQQASAPRGRAGREGGRAWGSGAGPALDRQRTSKGAKRVGRAGVGLPALLPLPRCCRLLAGRLHPHARRAAKASGRKCVRTRPGLVV